MYFVDALGHRFRVCAVTAVNLKIDRVSFYIIRRFNTPIEEILPTNVRIRELTTTYSYFTIVVSILHASLCPIFDFT